VTDIEAKFTKRMFEIYLQAKQEAGYTASIFYGMVSDDGGLITAKTLINAPKESAGYTALYLRGYLKLTVEAVVIEEPQWQSLFTEDELERARRRLKKYGYAPKVTT